MQYKTEIITPVGKYIATSDGQNLTGLWMIGQKYFVLTNDYVLKSELEIFVQTKKWLKRYFEGKKPAISELVLSPLGNKFKQDVWQLLTEIPYGEVVTYGELAQKIAHKQGKTRMSAQAIGGAVGHNPISIIIPCHRVIGKNKKLIGYAGGLDVKIKLLQLENSISKCKFD